MTGVLFEPTTSSSVVHSEYTNAPPKTPRIEHKNFWSVVHAKGYEIIFICETKSESNLEG